MKTKCKTHKREKKYLTPKTKTVSQIIQQFLVFNQSLDRDLENKGFGGHVGGKQDHIKVPPT